LFLLPAGETDASALGVLDTNDRIWWADGAGVTGVPVPPSPPWRNARRAASSSDALFVLDEGRGQIVRYTMARSVSSRTAAPTLGDAGQDWLVAPADLRGAVDIAIADGVYVAFGDGRLVRFDDGLPQEASLSHVPQGIGRICAMDAVMAAPADAPAESVTLLAADRGYGRIVVAGADGGFLEQLLRPQQARAIDPVAGAGRFADLHDVWWDAKRAILYVAAGSTVYRSVDWQPENAATRVEEPHTIGP
jgi:hypothetical protein